MLFYVLVLFTTTEGLKANKRVVNMTSFIRTVLACTLSGCDCRACRPACCLAFLSVARMTYCQYFFHINIKRFSETSSSFVLRGHSKRATERVCERVGEGDGGMEWRLQPEATASLCLLFKAGK